MTRLNNTRIVWAHAVEQEAISKEIGYMLENNIIEKSNGLWSSPCILIPKPDGSFRFCTDYRKVNNITKTDSFPITRIDDLIDKMGNSVYISKFDMLKGVLAIAPYS